MSIGRLQAFSRKFIYWSGLINIITLLFAGLVFSLIISLRFVFITPIGLWLLISIFPSDLFRKKILDHDKIAIVLQLLFLVVIAIANLIMILDTYFSYSLNNVIISYLMFLIMPLSTIGVFIGVIPLLLMYITSLMGLEPTIIAPIIFIIALIYIVVLIIHNSL